MNKKILIIGHARHGKDTVAEFLKELVGYTYESSSEAASRIFLYDALKDKYGYKNPQECFEDRVNHRQEWHDLIVEFNKDDKARLAKEILKNSNIYVGMRSNVEAEECFKQDLFYLVIGVYDPRKALEPETSFNIDIREASDVMIINDGTLEELKEKIKNLVTLIKIDDYD